MTFQVQKNGGILDKYRYFYSSTSQYGDASSSEKGVHIMYCDPVIESTVLVSSSSASVHGSVLLLHYRTLSEFPLLLLRCNCVAALNGYMLLNE